MYNSDNYQKHTTNNPVKRKMINRFNISLIELIRKIKPGNSFSILDAGCGEGFGISLVNEAFPESEITGIDFSYKALSVALEGNSINYIQGNVYHLPVETNFFDIVLCSEVLEHLQNPEDALLELNRVSANWVICTVPNEPWFRLGNLLSLKNVIRLGNPHDHINHFSIGQFANFVSSVIGYRVKSFSAFPWSVVYYKKAT